MSLEKQKEEAYYLIDKLQLEQSIFWEYLHNLVELAGDQFIGTRISFIEQKAEKAEKADTGGALILSVILNFGFSAFPIHSMVAGTLIKGLRRSKTIQKMIHKNVVNKLLKLPAEQLKRMNDKDLIEYENETFKKLKNEIGNGLKHFIKDEVKNSLKTRKKNRVSNQKQDNQSQGHVMIKKELYNWILAHKSLDIKQLIDLKYAVKSGEWNEDSVNKEVIKLKNLLDETRKSPTRDLNPDDFQLLIEAALWCATYDFYPVYKAKNKTTLIISPIKLPDNDRFWEYLVLRFIKNNFMIRVFHGEPPETGNFINRVVFDTKARQKDLNAMHKKYWTPPQTSVGGYNAVGKEGAKNKTFDKKDEEKMLLTYYFDELSTRLDKIQDKIVRGIDN
ncbi:MAG: hypothetical protein ACNS62_22870 [Candidatus Cyclobacteriaceae bacterium M3_2C_046]